jgi:hypothetical protein
MSDDTHDAVYNVCAYYQMVGYLVAFGVLDRRLAILAHHYRVIKTWSVVRPYVEAERGIRGSDYSFLNFLEDFAIMCQRASLTDIYIYVRDQAFGHRNWLRLPVRQ